MRLTGAALGIMLVVVIVIGAVAIDDDLFAFQTRQVQLTPENPPQTEPLSPAANIQIHLTSDPFPLAVGPTTMRVSLLGADGLPIENADVQMSAEMDHIGMMPLVAHNVGSSGGDYDLSIIWSMMGDWYIDVSAAIPGQETPFHERFKVYIYAVPTRNEGTVTTFRSASEVDAMVASRTERELWVVIPQGTSEMMRAGQGDDIVPEEIYLQVSGQNTIVIRNDDIVDHTVGPFFVAAGETLRQEFTRPAEFVGTCTIRHLGEVSLIVEA